MEFIVLAFSLKGQNVEEIIATIEKLPVSRDNILIHGCMPRKLIVEKELSEKIWDTLDENFPIQLNMFREGKTLHVEMAEVAKQVNAKVFVIGSVETEGISKEVNLYKENGLSISYHPLQKIE